MYSRQKAINYAYKWWNNRNPYFYNFDNIGGDCTNFVSQCLFYGGIEMDYSTLGWYYVNQYNRAPAWTGVDAFFNYSTKNNHPVGVRTKVANINEVAEGDVIQMMQIGEDIYHHTMLITKILGKHNLENILVTCHTFDEKDKALCDYSIKNLRFLKVLNDGI